MKPNIARRKSTCSTIVVWMLCGLYLLFSVGIVKATHFCMGREASVSYFTAQSKKCACSLFSKEKDDCCDDESALLKLNDSKNNLAGFKIALPALALLGQIYNPLPDLSNGDTGRSRFIAADAQPPPKALFKILCSYVFYDSKSIA